jgi:hypothetical protein
LHLYDVENHSCPAGPAEPPHVGVDRATRDVADNDVVLAGPVRRKRHVRGAPGPGQYDDVLSLSSAYLAHRAARSVGDGQPRAE